MAEDVESHREVCAVPVCASTVQLTRYSWMWELVLLVRFFCSALHEQCGSAAGLSAA